MKKLISILSICLVCLFAVSPLTTYAITPIDPLKDSSLTICYQHNDRPYEGLKVRTYRIAEVFADGTYALTGSFKDYPVSIYAVTSQSEWKQIASTLEAYAIADQLPPTRIGVTDAKGCVAFTDILPGMYLTMAIRVERETDITLFECFLSVVPYPSEDGAHDYDVEVYPKCQTITPTPQEKEYKVVKQWKDNGFVEKRPDNVKVDIYKDGVLQSTQELSAENHWCYSWKAPDDGGDWTAVEREIPAEYTVTVVEKGTTIVITNVLDYDPPPPPQTGDTTVLWPWVLSLCISGAIITVLATWRRRRTV